MKIDIIRLFQDYGVEYTDNHPHVTQGWVNVHCPFCTGSRNYHLGVNLSNGACNCWRCGGHSLFKVIQVLLNIQKHEINKVIKAYMDDEALLTISKRRKYKNKLNKELVIKTPYTELTEKHRCYLEGRGFDVSTLENIWGVKSFGVVGDYRYRIFIPIYFKNKMISYQGRTTSPDVVPRYKTCNKNDELLHHKYIVYGYDYAMLGDTAVVVEGVTDAWRIGIGAVATFGMTYTITQALLLANFKKVYILYDNEKQAQKQAYNLAKDIGLLGKSKVYVIKDYDASDPGSMSKKEVKRIRKLIDGV